MLIPSIDLQGGRIVQLVQGEKLAIETYVTDADSAGALTKVLRASLADVGHVKVSAVIDDECPDPWIWCENRRRCCGECGSDEAQAHGKGSDYQDD